jgi:hypothetical protein
MFRFSSLFSQERHSLPKIEGQLLEMNHLLAELHHRTSVIEVTVRSLANNEVRLGEIVENLRLVCEGTFDRLENATLVMERQLLREFPSSPDRGF